MQFSHCVCTELSSRMLYLQIRRKMSMNAGKASCWMKLQSRWKSSEFYQSNSRTVLRGLRNFKTELKSILSTLNEKQIIVQFISSLLPSEPYLKNLWKQQLKPMFWSSVVWSWILKKNSNSLQVLAIKLRRVKKSFFSWVNMCFKA